MYDSFPQTFGESEGNLNIYVDNNVYFLQDRIDEHGVCLLVEPRAIIPSTYEWVEKKWNHFKYVFTFDSRILEKVPNAKLMYYGQITVDAPEVEKTKDISMVCSDKAFCDGHRRRQNVAFKLKPFIDTYGKFDGGQYCDNFVPYQDYLFNVAMENYSDGYYFTEKIGNCFANRVVPIYWGCPHIAELFNPDGIIICKNPSDVIDSVHEILKDPIGEYNKRIEAIEENKRRMEHYRSFAKLFLDTYKDLLEEIAKC